MSKCKESCCCSARDAWYQQHINVTSSFCVSWWSKDFKLKYRRSILGVVWSVWTHFDNGRYGSCLFYFRQPPRMLWTIAVLFWVTQRFSWWTMQLLWECAQLLMHLACLRGSHQSCYFPCSEGALPVVNYLSRSLLFGIVMPCLPHSMTILLLTPVAVLLLACFASVLQCFSRPRSSLETLSTCGRCNHCLDVWYTALLLHVNIMS